MKKLIATFAIFAVHVSAVLAADQQPLETPVRNNGEKDQLGILTPPPSAAPRINGAKVFGVRPGHPILWRLPVTGERPVRLSATGLPDGATFNAERGILGGSVAKLSLGDSVDLSGVTLRAADDDAEAVARGRFCTVLDVPEFCEIRGLPVVTSNYKLRVVQTADGGQALQAKVRNGFVLIVH